MLKANSNNTSEPSAMRSTTKHAAVVLLMALTLVLTALLRPDAAFAEFTAKSVGDYGNVAVMEVDGNFDDELNGATNWEPRAAITKEFYKTHKDEYDFLVIFTNFDFDMGVARGFYLGVRNNTHGVGLNIFDNSAYYGSNSVLQGTIDMGNLASKASVPVEKDFMFTMDTLSHEVLHRWAAFVKFKDRDGSISSKLIGRGGSHWSYLLDTGASLEYGSDWVDNGNGTFTATRIRYGYSPIDMYLMGFIDKSQVPPMLLIENPSIDPTQLPQQGQTITGTAHYVTIDDIIAVEGERIPNWQQSQKHFRVAFVYAVRPGTFNSYDISSLETIRDQWMTNFSVLTDGKAMASVDLVQRDAQGPGVPGPVVTPRTRPANIDEAMAWLLARQKTDGSWADGPRSSRRDSAAAISALVTVDTETSATQAGAQWLSAQQAENVDYLSRQIEALAEAGGQTDALVQRLMAMQNSDGGWGSATGYLSNPTDTSFALRALARALPVEMSTEDEIYWKVSYALGYMFYNRSSDGGWGTVKGQSNILVTSNALVASRLWKFDPEYDWASIQASAIEWLKSKQNTDGGFGNSPSTVYDTAVAVSALMDVEGYSHKVGSAASYLMTQQAEDGSWHASTYETALALNAAWEATIAPNLEIKSEDISFDPGTVNTLPTSMTLTAKVTNHGRTDVVDASVYLYKGDPKSGGVLMEKKFATVPGQQSVTVFFTFDVAVKETVRYYIVLDEENVIEESDERNNVAYSIIRYGDEVDLEVNDQDVTVPAGAVNVLSEVSIGALVHNRGAASAYAVTVKYLLVTPDGEMEIGTDTVDVLSGSSAQSSISWRASRVGEAMTVRVVVDPLNLIAESAEGNNAAQAQLTVVDITAPNLEMLRGQVRMEPAVALEGGALQVSADLKNTGNAAAQDVLVRFMVGNPTTGTLIGSETVASLAVGETRTIHATWSPIAGSGQKVIYAMADPDSMIQEISEGDNQDFVKVDVLSLPDVALTESSISYSPSSPKTGDEIAMSIMMQNLGDQAAQGAVAAVYENGMELCRTQAVTIEGKGFATMQCVVQTTGMRGSVSLLVKADPDGMLNEKVLGNNTVTKRLSIQDNRLWLDEAYISPNSDGVKDSAWFYYGWDGARTVSVRMADANGNEVRRYVGSDFVNTTFVSLNWDGRGADGGVVPDGQYTIDVRDASDASMASLIVVVDNNRTRYVDTFGTPYLLDMWLGNTGGESFDSTYRISANDRISKRHDVEWLPDDRGVLLRRKIYQTFDVIVTCSATNCVTPTWTRTYGIESYNLSILSTDGYEKLTLTDEGEVNFPTSATVYADDYHVTAQGDVVLARIITQFATLTATNNDKYRKGTHVSDVVLYDRLGEVKTLASIPGRVQDMTVSHDGQKVLVTVRPNTVNAVSSATELWLVGVNSQAALLVDSVANGSIIIDEEYSRYASSSYYSYYTPWQAWSPDSTRVVYKKVSGANKEVKAYSLSGAVASIQAPLISTSNSNLCNLVWINNDEVAYNFVDSSVLTEDYYGYYLYDVSLLKSNMSGATSVIEAAGTAHEYYLHPTPPDYSGFFYGGYNYVDYTNIIRSTNGGQSYAPEGVRETLTFSDSILGFNQANGKLYALIWNLEGVDKLVKVDAATGNVEQEPILWDGITSSDVQGLRGSYPWFDGFMDNDSGYMFSLYSYSGNGIGRKTGAQFYYDAKANRLINYLNNHYGSYFDKTIFLSPSKQNIANVDFITGMGEGALNLLSVANLKAAFVSQGSSRGMVIKGIAADLNFEGYQLEYAEEATAEDFKPISLLNTSQVLDDELAIWIPPHEGAYQVSLTVWDKAGNVDSVQKRVTWRPSQHPSVGGFYKSTDSFSPNGDGTKDSIDVRYQTYGPYVLNFTVTNDSGMVVKTAELRHMVAEPGVFTWDGTDQSGRLVSDGYYKISVQSYVFTVQVDTKAPVVDISRSSLGWEIFYDSRRGTSEGYFGVIVNGLAYDENLTRWQYQVGLGGVDDEWREEGKDDKSFAVLDTYGRLLPNELQRLGSYSSMGTDDGYAHGLPEYAHMSLRMVAEDKAGNRSVKVLPPMPWRVYIDKVDMSLIENPELSATASPMLYEYTAAGKHRIKGLSTIPQEYVQEVHVQYFDGTQWKEGVTDELASWAPRVDVKWDDGGEIFYALRLRVRTIDGADQYSNEVAFQNALSIDPCSWSIFNGIYEDLVSLVLEVISYDDERFSEWTPMRTYDAPVTRGGWLLTSRTPLRIGYSYSLRLRAVTASGEEFNTDEVQYPEPVCAVIDPVFSIEVTYKEASCDKASKQEVISVKEQDTGTNSHISTKAYLDKPTGMVEVPFGLIDTSQLHEGEYTVLGVMTYKDPTGQVHEARSTARLIVERKSPLVQFTWPMQGDMVCPTIVETTSGYQSIVQVQAKVSDDLRVKYALYYSTGTTTGSWSAAKSTDGKAIVGSTQIDGTIGDWSIQNTVGSVLNLQLRATDLVGNTTCQSVSFNADRGAEIQSLVIDPSAISPNADGTMDEALCKVQTSEYGVVSMDVVQKSGASNAGAIIKTLLASAQTNAGVLDAYWDGTDLAGASMAEGQYEVVARLKDSCGNETSMSKPVSIDLTSPVIEIATPLPGEVIYRSSLEVTGSVNDANLKSYTLEVGQGADPTVWSQVAQGSTTLNNAIIGKFDAQGKTGQWTFRLTARDIAGNQAQTTRTFMLETLDNMVKSVSATPTLISPNADSVLDDMTITVETVMPGTLGIEVLNSAGQSVRKLNLGSVQPGVHTHLWAGEADSGAKVADGKYTIKIKASPSAHPSVIQEEVITVETDTVNPTISVQRPAPYAFLKEDADVQGSITDAHLSGYEVLLKDPMGQVEALASGTSTVSSLGSLKGLSDGTYELSVSAHDRAGNSSERMIHFMVDKTSPVVNLASPADGVLYGGTENMVKIEAQLEEANPDVYKLSATRTGGQPIVIDQATGLTQSSPISRQWSVDRQAGVSDGVYVIALSYTDRAGQEGKAQVSIEVDNTPPTVSIIAPAQGAVVSAGIEVNGTASDTHFGQYMLEVSEGKCATATAWRVLSSAVTSLASGVLGAIDQGAADGEYCLRLKATDKLGNAAEVIREFTVASTRPSAPILSGTIKDVVNVELQWVSAGQDDGLFNVYRDGVRLNADPTSSTVYLDSALQPGAYAYSVRAVNDRGIESEPSNLVTLTIRQATPEAQIATPASGKTVGGVVEIKGKAYSAAAFKQYRLEVGQGLAPQQWSLVKLSTIPVEYGTLGRWYATDIAEGQYTIRLTVETTLGQSAQAQSTVTIDNAAPAAPVLLSVTASGDRVTVDWADNAESDIATYYIYRGYKRVADQRTSLYVDSTVPDGTFEYTVVAIDMAGNESGPSNGITVTIDTRAPHATITSPAYGQTFDSAFPVSATSTDEDVSSIQFRISPVGSSSWTNVGEPVIHEPYTVNLDPRALGLTLDMTYVVDALAVDMGGRADSAPGYTSFKYALTPPAKPTGLTKSVKGERVTLKWQANEEQDLVGYNVYRKPSGSTTAQKINADLVGQPEYVDTVLADRYYTYYVTAIDKNLAESVASDEVFVQTFSAALEQVYTPTTSGNLILRAGANVFSYIRIEDAESGDVLAVSELPVSSNGSTISVNLANGVHFIRAVGVTSDGDESKPSQDTAYIIDDAPAAPTGFTAELQGQIGMLAWNANTEQDLLGYLLYKNGAMLNQQYAAPIASVSASSTSGSPSNVIDGLPSTGWSGETLEIVFDGKHIIDRMDIQWAQPGDAKVEVWSGYSWVAITNVYDFSGTQIVMNPYRTDRVRLSSWAGMSINEISFNAIQPITATTYTDSINEYGSWFYWLKAIDNYALTSPWVDKTVERQYAPQAPTNLTATANNSAMDITLSWNEPVDLMIQSYRVYQNNYGNWYQVATVQQSYAYGSQCTSTKIAACEQLRAGYQTSQYIVQGCEQCLATPFGGTFVDSYLSPGTYTYYVKAYAVTGQESAQSNQASATIANQSSLPAPQNLRATALDMTTVRLDWSPVDRPDVHSYNIYTGGNLFEGEWMMPPDGGYVRVGWCDPRMIPYCESLIAQRRAWEYNSSGCGFCQSGTVTALVQGFPHVPGMPIGFRVTAYTRSGETPPSNEVYVTLGETVSPPTGLVANAVSGESSVRLSWNASAAPNRGYDIYRKAGDQTSFYKINSSVLFDSNYVDYGLTNGTTYVYYVVVYSSFGTQSQPSNQASATINLPVSAPYNLSASPDSSTRTIALNWQWDGFEIRKQLFEVYRKGKPFNEFTYIGSAWGGAYTDRGDTTEVPGGGTRSLSEGEQYEYYVVARDGLKLSAPSNTASAMLMAKPFITSPAIAGDVLTVQSPLVDVAGLSSVGVPVELYHNGSKVATTEAVSYSEQVYPFDSASAVQAFSPDGRRAVLSSGGILSLYDTRTGVSATVGEGGLPSWKSAHELVYVVNKAGGQYDIRSYTVDSALDTLVLTASGAALQAPSWCVQCGKAVFVVQNEFGRRPVVFDSEAKTVSDLLPIAGQVNAIRISPDGQRVAYTATDGKLYVMDLGAGSGTLVFPYAGAGLQWSRDSRKLAFTNTANNSIHSYDIDTKLLGNVASEAALSSPLWSPDGRSILARRAYADLVLYPYTGDYEQGEKLTSANGPFDWTAHGEIMMSNGSSIVVAQPEGYFNFGRLSLERGANTLQVLSVPDGDMSQALWSDEVLVEFDPMVFDQLPMPDIMMQDSEVAISPAVATPGQGLSVSYVVRNAGNADATNVQVDVSALSPDGTVLKHWSTAHGTIATGGEIVGQVQWQAPQAIGKYAFIANASMLNVTQERDMGNNSAAAYFETVGSAKLSLRTALDAQTYQAWQDMEIRHEVLNPGLPLGYTLQSQIEDANGYLVESLPVLEGSAGVGQRSAHTQWWNTGRYFAGQYTVKTVLRGQDGDEIVTTVPFEIVPVYEIKAAVWSNKITYGANEEVLVSARVESISENYIVPAMQVACWVEDASGVRVAEVLREFVDVMPSEASTMQLRWSSQQALAGTYTVRVAASIAGDTVAQSQGTFEIKQQVVVVGSLDVEPTAIPVGGIATVTYSIRNNGNVALAGEPVWITIDGSSQLELGSLWLTPGQEIAATATLPVNGLGMGNHTVELYYSRSGVNVLMAQAQLAVVDSNPPAVSVAAPLGGALVGMRFSMEATATDAETSISAVQWSMDSQETWHEASRIGADSARFVALVEMPEGSDGPHVLYVRAIDQQGNEGHAAPVAFTSDVTPPAPPTFISPLNMSFIAQGVTDVAISTEPGSIVIFTVNSKVIAKSLSPDGALLFNSVALPLTKNVLTARAQDSVGNLSESTVVAVYTDIDVAAGIAGLGSSYGAWQAVDFTVDVVNSESQYNVEELTLNFAIKDQQGAALHEGAYQVTDLGAGASWQTAVNWNARDYAPGTYATSVTAVYHGVEVSSSTKSFTISETVDLRGSVLAEPETVSMGADLAVSSALVNKGNVPIEGATAHIRLVDADNLSVVMEKETTLSLSVSQETLWQVNLSTQGLPAGSYSVELSALVSGSPLVLGTDSVEVVDNILPIVQPISPEQDQFVAGLVNVKATASDNSGSVAWVQYRINDGGWIGMIETVGSSGQYEAQWATSQYSDGSYVLEFRAADFSGNASDTRSVGVVVDNTAPLAPVILTPEDNTTVSAPTVDVSMLVEPLATVEVETSTGIMRAINDSTDELQITGVPLLQGENTLQFVAVDRAGNRSVPAMLKVVLAQSQADVSFTRVDRKNLLVWLNGSCDYVAVYERGQAPGSGCGDLMLLGEVLGQVSDSHHLAYTREDFQSELRNPFYTDILILGDKLPLTGNSIDELRERVYSGTGLVSSLWIDNSGDAFSNGHSMQGVTFNGYLNDRYDAFLAQPSELFEDGVSLEVSGRRARVAPVGSASNYGNLIGGVSDAPQVSAVFNSDGAGSSIYLAFDVELSLNGSTRAQMFAVLDQVLSFVHMEELLETALPYGIVEFSSVISSISSEPLEVWQTVEYADGLNIFDEASGQWVDDNPWKQQLVLPTGQHEQTVAVLVPDASGDYIVKYEVKDSTLAHELGSIVASFGVGSTLADATEGIIEMLSHDSSKQARVVQKEMEKVLLGLDSGGADTEATIKPLLQALRACRGVSTLAEVRLRASRVLFSLMGKEYLGL